jgi:HAD superfamily hydrolase (TIGR01509 family)
VFDQLILDAGNVLIADAMPALFADLAAVAGASNAVEALFQRHTSVSRRLWRGDMSETAYWEHLARALDVKFDSTWRDLLVAHLRPLVAAEVLAAWAKQVELVLLSNHRTEWLVPALTDAGYLKYFDKLVISDSVGFVKPEREIFELTAPPSSRAVFVDDRESNLVVARLLGWETVAADLSQHWVTVVSSLLEIES